MHAKDPVNWQLWNSDTLELARQTNKPILVSSGYYACHWCHVMQQENYQNLATAKLINQFFIPVKIDRELNPELDSILVSFSKQTTGQGGWPQHAILTPNGSPFAAFIYLPNLELNAYLNRVAQLWKTNSHQVIQLAETPNKPQPSTANAGISTQQLHEALLTALYDNKDELSGGLKGTSKFPQAPLLNSLLTVKTNEATDEWLQTTLDMMQSEHLFDHIHGGFYRYTVDPEWQIPHFEKMAYDSALLAQTYLLAAKRFNRKDYLVTAKATLDYLQSQLYNQKTGLFQSSLSAIDQQGIEGGDYIFSKQQLKNQLTAEEFTLVETEWNLQNPPPYEQGWHPKVIDSPLWSEIKRKLTVDVNVIPKDKKSVMSWNGLMLSAMSLAAEQLAHYEQDNPEQNYQEQAKQLATHLLKLILGDKPPRVVTVNGKYAGTANLEDYAFILQGLYDYSKFTRDEHFSQQVKTLEDKILNKFYKNHRWQFTASPLVSNVTNTDFNKDGPLPSVLAIVRCLTPKSPQTPSDLLETPLEFASFLYQGRSLNCKTGRNSVK